MASELACKRARPELPASPSPPPLLTLESLPDDLLGDALSQGDSYDAILVAQASDVLMRNFARTIKPWQLPELMHSHKWDLTCPTEQRLLELHNEFLREAEAFTDAPPEFHVGLRRLLIDSGALVAARLDMLTSVDVRNGTATSGEDLAVALLSLPRLHTLALVAGRIVDVPGVVPVTCSTALVSVELIASHGRIPETIARSVATSRNMKKLHWGCNCNSNSPCAGDQFLSWLTNVEELCIHCNGPTNATNLAELRNLRTFECSGSSVTHVTTLLRMPLLQSVSVHVGGTLDDEVFQHVAEAKSLMSLTVRISEQLTDVGIGYVSLARSLTCLVLQDCPQLTDESLRHVARLPCLSALVLAECSGLTDAGLALLQPLTSLTTLSLFREANISDSGLAHLVKLPHVTLLKLAHMQRVGDEGLGHIARMPRLEYVHITNCRRITSTGLVRLCDSPELSIMEICGCGGAVNDAVLAALEKLPRLEVFFCQDAEHVTDVGIESLLNMKVATFLAIHGAPRVSDECIDMVLQRLRPGCTLIVDQ